MKSNDVLFWIWLSEALGAASKSFRTLISLYENPYDIFHAEESELERIPELSERVRLALSNKSLQRASEILDRCERIGVKLLCYGDEAYPHALREIKNPPVLLYYRGILPDFNRRLCVGMVGTRSMSAYGLRSAYTMAYELASANALIVSGMAKGIDGVSAAAALAAKGTTVAVLGSGVDVVYPPHHKNLCEAIEVSGAILSEYPPGTPPYGYHFPVRNRIISGISQATVVVEAGIGSGSLITAKDAILQGRDVFALPANVGSKGAEGTNGLLRDGVNLALSSNDIIDHYRYAYATALQTERLQKAEGTVEVDLPYLASLGVIELSGDRTAASERQAAVSAVPKPTEATLKSSEKTAKKKKSGASVTHAPNGEKPAREALTSLEAPTQKRENADAVLSSLSEVQTAILQAIPDDEAVAADTLCNLGYPYGEIIAALTMLEIMGLLQKLPGSLYKKA